jgi:hypothetical protein
MNWYHGMPTPQINWDRHAVADMAALTLAKAHNKTMVAFSLKNPMGLMGLMQGKMECSRISVAKTF